MASTDNMQCLPAVLSIDIGSTKARAILAWRKGDETQTRNVDFHKAHPLQECSSAIFPFDKDPVKYDPYELRQRPREKLPVKFVPFVILDKIDYMKEENPVAIRLKKERSKVDFNETLFKAVLEDASKELLRFILVAAKDTLDTYKHKPNSSQIQIKTVAIAVPSQWDASFQNQWEQLLKEAFAGIFEEMSPVAARDINVVFHNEATAIAHYFLQHSSDAHGLNLRNDGIIPNIDAVAHSINTQLFIHCGANHASSILTTIQRDENGQRVLCEGGRSQGAEGGTEWWTEHLVDDTIDRFMVPALFGHREHTPEVHDAYKRIITGQGHRLAIMNGLDIRMAFSDPRQPDCLVSFARQFTKDDHDRASYFGFRHVQRMIREQLRRVSSIKSGWATKEHTVTIVMTAESMTDGSSLHPAFVAWMEEYCTELGLPKAITLETMAQFCGASQVAMGAAYATLAQQARSIAAPKGPSSRIIEFGSEQGQANERRLRDLRYPFLKHLREDTAKDARPDGVTKHSPSDNVSSSGEASSSRQMDSASDTPEADASKTAGRKRKALQEPEEAAPAKLVHTMRGLPIRTVSSTSKDVSSSGNDTSSTGIVTRVLPVRSARLASKNASSTGKDGSST